MEQSAYLKLIAQSGLTVEKTRVNEAYGFTGQSTANAAVKFQVRSISILARK